MTLNNNQMDFISLLKAGLWETEVRLAPHEIIDYDRIYKLAEEQSVVGLIAAGIEHVQDKKIPQEVARLHLLEVRCK